jgi:hypothetical protein
MRRRTDKNEDGIEALSEQELGVASGGKAPYEKCHVSNKDRETAGLPMAAIT